MSVLRMQKYCRKENKCMDYTREIIKKVDSMSGSKSSFCVFSDWVKCTALTIAQSVYYNEKREKQFLEIINEYPKYEFAKMTAMLTQTFEDKFGDVLGNLFMMSGWGNKNTGQFFTPYSLSLACANLQKYSKDDILEMNEPSAGAGGMVIAVAQTMKEQDINYQKKLRVVAQDLDWNALYMCYIQLSLLGIDAKCVQGDTLENKNFDNLAENVFLTPMYFLNGCVW